jgi:tetratricopeptide (TPR) repeat protein
MSSDSGYDEAVALYRAGQFYSCLEACERILGQTPDNAPVLHLVGLLCYKGGDANTAGAYFAKAIAADPDYPEAYPDLALTLKNQGRIDEAIEIYRKGLDLDPTNAQAHYNYGLALRSTGQDRQALAAFREAVTLNPMVPGGFVALGQTEAKLGNDFAALDCFRKAIAAEPESEAGYRNMASTARRMGQGHVAIDALRLGQSFLESTGIGRDLAGLLEDQSRPDEAVALLRGLTESAPADIDTWEELGELYFRLHRFQEALDVLSYCVAIDPLRSSVHLRLYSIAQIMGKRDLALAHQQQALAITRVFTETGLDPARPRILLLKAPGDWQANVPTDFIIRGQEWGTLHHYFVSADDSASAADLPPVDIIFNAVAEPDRTRPELKAAQIIIDALGLPALNLPERVARTGRADIAMALAGLPGCIVPATFRIERDGALDRLTDLLNAGALSVPFLLRPVGTHAGQGLTLIESLAALPDVIHDLEGDTFYATQYVDYRGSDGLYRKYRVIVVDGTPYPFHMGLSKRWMVHYYNSEPDDQAHMDREEERFLAAFADVFPKTARDAFGLMNQRLGLDFFGVDCGLMADGTLVLFEIDVGVIVHLMDDPVRYAYKHRHVPAIFQAVRTMIESRIVSSAQPNSGS